MSDSNKLRQMALEVFNSYPEGWSDEAVQALIAKIFDNDELTAEAVAQCAKRELGDVARQINHASRIAATGVIWKPKKYSREQQKENRQNAYRRLLLDTHIPTHHGRILLGKASREQVLEAAEIYCTNADGNRREEWVCRAIAKKLRNGQLVEEVFDQKKMTELRQKVVSELNSSSVGEAS